MTKSAYKQMEHTWLDWKLFPHQIWSNTNWLCWQPLHANLNRSCNRGKASCYKQLKNSHLLCRDSFYNVVYKLILFWLCLSQKTYISNMWNAQGKYWLLFPYRLTISTFTVYGTILHILLFTFLLQNKLTTCKCWNGENIIST